MLRMKPSQVLEFRDLLRVAFLEGDFEDLLLRLDRELTDFASSADPYPKKIKLAVEHANAGLWWRELLREAINQRPTDAGLTAFVAKTGIAPATVAAGPVVGPTAAPAAMTAVNGRSLELKIKAAQSTFDIMTWRQKLTDIEGRVCRIEFPDKIARGTGLLVAPGVVMTNYHVIEAVHNQQIGPGKIVVRFDYKVLANGVSVGEGRTCGVAPDWLADFSEYSKLDFETAPAIDPPADKLDYALLRLDAQPGNDAVNGATRGWIQVPAQAHDFAASPALYIVQHPDGKPMQIAIDSEAVVKSSPTRVRYTTTTEPGSSGSPCFSADWDWVALHHSGDPKHWAAGKKPEYNQGIPLAAIVKLLKQRDMLKLLGSP